jgi:hypothetical protein
MYFAISVLQQGATSKLWELTARAAAAQMDMVSWASLGQRCCNDDPLLKPNCLCFRRSYVLRLGHQQSHRGVLPVVGEKLVEPPLLPHSPLTFL